MHEATQSPIITRRRLLEVDTAVGVGVAAAAPFEWDWTHRKRCQQRHQVSGEVNRRTARRGSG